MGGPELILLDTHALLWMSDQNPAMGATARELAEDSQQKGELAASAISFWEVAILINKGRLEAREPVEIWRAAHLRAGLIEIPLDGLTACQAVALPGLPGDPADRWIVATALRHDATLVTADRNLLRWDGGLKTHDARL